jgi:hypothetical protein
MICQEILTKLVMYQLQLMKIFSAEAQADLSIEISSQYAFVVVDVSKASKPYVHLKFVVDGTNGILQEVYSESKSTQADIKSKVEAQKWPGLQANNGFELPFTGEVLTSIKTADSIASLAVNCTTGDNYHPGNFSKVMLTKDLIELSQINFMNSRSLDHKSDYSLRSLVFTIPLRKDTALKEKFGQRKMGNMIVEFEDRSSQNNRHCGDRIAGEIEKRI